MRVLVADDNEDTAELLGDLLTLLGHSVTVVHDGLQAVQCIARAAQDAVLLDLEMPVMDGYDAARAIHAGWPGVLLVAVSGHGSAQDRARSQAAGFDCHLAKPLDTRELEGILAGAAH